MSSSGSGGVTGIAIGTVTTGAPGSDAEVTTSVDPATEDTQINFTIPTGENGAAATVAVGTVTTGDAGTDAAVTNSGTSSAAVLDFTIPKGAAGSVTQIGSDKPNGDGVVTLSAASIPALDQYALIDGTAQTISAADQTQARTNIGAAPIIVAYVDDHGGDPTDTNDSTDAFNAALAALPTFTDSNGNTCSRGVVQFGNGIYRIDGDTDDPGPYVMIRGVDRYATVLDYHGAGDCLRMHYDHAAASGAYDASFAGGVKNLTIDGANSTAGANGLHAGDMSELRLNLAIRNFAGDGSIGLWLDNTITWTDMCRGDVTLSNCATHVKFGVSTSTHKSHEYSDWYFSIYAEEGQDGIVIDDNVLFVGVRIFVTGQFVGSDTISTNTPLRIGANVNAQAINIHFVVETPSGTTHNPTTMVVDGSAVVNGVGIMRWGGLGTWTPADPTAGSQPLQLLGQFIGDTSVAGAASAGALLAVGALGGTVGFAGQGGQLQMGFGDYFKLVLKNASTTITFAGVDPVPQRKTVVIKQSGSGDLCTVTWPSNAAPTTASPTVLWESGAAPTMTQTYGAVDVYELSTVDGATWYGRATQNVS